MPAKKVTPEIKKRAALPRDENGVVDWRNLVDRKDLLLNFNYYAARGINIDLLTPEEIEEFKKTAEPEGLMLSLMGCRHLGNKRGLKAVNYNLVYSDKELAIMRCSITFVESEDEPETIYDSLGSASINNVSGKFSTHLVALAENRSFCRAVRNYLMIPSVTYEEIDPTQKDSVVSLPKPSLVLIQHMEKKGITFEQLKQMVIEDGKYEWKDWNTVEQISSAAAFTFVGSYFKPES